MTGGPQSPALRCATPHLAGERLCRVLGSTRKSCSLGVFGDSVAGRLVEAFSSMLGCCPLGGPNRSSFRQEEKVDLGRFPDRSFFLQSGRTHLKHYLQLAARDMSGGLNREWLSCGDERAGRSRLEYFATEGVIDTAVTRRRRVSGGNIERDVKHVCDDAQLRRRRPPCAQELTTAQFVFGYWWDGRTCPDLIFHHSTAAHDLQRHTNRSYERDVRWLFALVAEFLDVSCPSTE